jgi:hypothetical protein
VRDTAQWVHGLRFVRPDSLARGAGVHL